MCAQVGEIAPPFEAEALVGKDFKMISSESYEGKWILLFFYPLDFTFVCPTELLELNKRYKEFEDLNCQIIGSSTDSVYSHQAWAKEIGQFNFPILADMTKQVAADYGVLVEEKGIALRGAFLIDPDGVLQASIIHNLPVGRNIDELLRVLKAFRTGELCPVNWEKGKKTLGKA
ncbi:MAG: thioredoxin peroxidase [Candidatus Abawacabacteria bacterium RBG_16_42_10]|uniref:Thioredoxin peroxidase n=1 Tax=Candidatus Abawacabacteria bacterium RBG_16_42_10 TaxID=1817814 RepID=A0A1F4XLZ9_9BACT|nr:MAG: thioredoxin peroxidase [Candidatus Abawacabacteria bacterium RBG_16_42_10]